MRLRDHDRLDPEVERQLDALDRALAGADVDSDLADWAELAQMLRDERPDPEPGWAAKLDEAAAARFPHPEDGGVSSITDLLTRIGDLMPRRMTPLVAGLATLAVVSVVAATTLSGGDGEQGAVSGTLSQDVEQVPTTAAPGDEDAAAGDALEIAPSTSADDATAYPGPGPDAGPISPGIANRKVDRDVTMTLAAPPEDVNDVSDEAIAIARDLDGIVARSNVSRAGDEAGATLELVIPTRNLDSAIDRLTEIADVKSLSESSVDITHPYVSAKDRLDDAEAERRELIEALGNADSAAEAEALRLQIADVRKEIARAEARFDRIARRAQLSEVSLTISGDRSASSGDDGDRTLGDWLDDAASVLRDVAGVLLISAAILVPLGLLAAIAWFVISRLLRRRRERALEQ